MDSTINNALTLRQATLMDLDFLVTVDRKDEGSGSTYMNDWGTAEIAEHRDKIAAFVLADDKAAWVCEDTKANRLAGMILWRYCNRLSGNLEEWSVIHQLEKNLFPPDGAFCEIYQLWVARDYRRRGLASRLKQQAETESLRRDVRLLYTHTEERNTHIIGMNLKLGYREVRRGPIWDKIVRVSLIKSLAGGSNM